MNTLVNFEIAKLLKEKGFKNGIHYNGMGEYFTNTTIAEVIMWLYEKHNIIIESHWEGTSEIDSFDARIIVLGKHILSKEYQDFKLSLDANSPTEAYTAAIKYTLTKLIK